MNSQIRLLATLERAETENLRIHSQAMAINATNNEVLAHQIGVILWHNQELESYLKMAKGQIKRLTNEKTEAEAESEAETETGGENEQ